MYSRSATYCKVLDVIDALEDGKTVTKAAREVGIAPGTLYRCLQHNPELQEEFEAAKKVGAEYMADALLEFDNDALYGQSDPKKAKIMSDNIKWRLARLHSDIYGDRVEHNHTVAVDVQITQRLNSARERVIDLGPDQYARLPNDG